MSISIIVPILLPTEALGDGGHTARGLQDLKAGTCLRVPRSTVDRICTVLETTSVCMCGVSVSEFLGMILRVEFLRMGDFSAVGHLCAYIDVYGSDGILHSLIVCVWMCLCDWATDCVLVGRAGLLWTMRKNLQHPSPPPCRMTAQGKLWIPNASFLFHSIVKMEFKQHLLTFQTVGHGRGEFGI